MKASKTYDGTIIYQRKKNEIGIRLNGSSDVAHWFNQNFFGKLDEVDAAKEHFLAAYLDARNQIKNVRLLAIGCLTGSLIHPREVFRPAVACSAAAMVLCHAHPSGDPTPSPEDVQLTERLVEAGRIIGIRCLDHVVVAENGYVSLMEHRTS